MSEELRYASTIRCNSDRWASALNACTLSWETHRKRDSCHGAIGSKDLPWSGLIESNRPPPAASLTPKRASSGGEPRPIKAPLQYQRDRRNLGNTEKNVSKYKHVHTLLHTLRTAQQLDPLMVIGYQHKGSMHGAVHTYCLPRCLSWTGQLERPEGIILIRRYPMSVSCISRNGQVIGGNGC